MFPSGDSRYNFRTWLNLLLNNRWETYYTYFMEMSLYTQHSVSLDNSCFWHMNEIQMCKQTLHRHNWYVCWSTMWCYHNCSYSVYQIISTIWWECVHLCAYMYLCVCVCLTVLDTTRSRLYRKRSVLVLLALSVFYICWSYGFVVYVSLCWFGCFLR